jgi:putative glycosyltransferase (TIGR04348 family)
LPNGSPTDFVRIRLAAPPPADLSNGNRITALRWARMLRAVGHRASVHHAYDGEACDAMIALHAVKSVPAIQCFRARFPDRPLVVCTTGTDLYGPASIEPALRKATRIIVLQRNALTKLPQRYRRIARVIYQSAEPLSPAPPPPRRHSRVAVIAHMRPIKDAFRTAYAARNLPDDSRIEVVHAGRPLRADMEPRARAEMEPNPRYRWVGDLTRSRARRLLASSHVVAITSRAEGSSNVLSEALVQKIPVIASRIPGLLGTLDARYPGWFPAGDTAALRRLLLRAGRDSDFYQRLRRAGAKSAPLVRPTRERASLRALVRELG